MNKKTNKKTGKKVIAPPLKGSTSEDLIYYVKDKKGNIVQKTLKKKKK